MAQTVHTRRSEDRLTRSERIHLWSGAVLVVVAILLLAVLS